MERLLKCIRKNIIEHHKLYPEIPLNNVHWESRLRDAFIECGSTVEWNANGHGAGMDMVVDGVKISCKGGRINKKDQLTISSHRTTKYKTLEEKILYISESHEDLVYSLAQKKGGYVLSIFKTPSFYNLDWQEGKKSYTAKGDGIKARIVFAMSDQLWYDLDSDKMLQRFHIDL